MSPSAFGHLIDALSAAQGAVRDLRAAHEFEAEDDMAAFHRARRSALRELASASQALTAAAPADPLDAIIADVCAITQRGEAQAHRMRINLQAGA